MMSIGTGNGRQLVPVSVVEGRTNVPGKGIPAVLSVLNAGGNSGGRNVNRHELANALAMVRKCIEGNDCCDTHCHECNWYIGPALSIQALEQAEKFFRMDGLKGKAVEMLL